MKRRGGEIQVFSMSFLDVLSCALGGTLLLLLLIQESQQEETEAQQQAMQQMQSRIDAAQQQVQQVQQELDEASKKSKSAQDRLKALAAANKKLKKAQTALTGINGKLQNVVFIFDTSGSMADNFKNPVDYKRNGPKRGPQFERYLDSLKRSVSTYPYTRFNVLRYSADVTAWKPNQMPEGTEGNRNAANRFIDTFQPGGGTATIKALKAAYALPNVDTIILFSDGIPLYKQGQTDKQAIDEVINWLKANKGDVVINTVAIGGSHKSPHRQFLRQIADMTGGTVQAIF